ncbi:choice-of-anchor D domain-containing protein [Burkholderia multivorans]|nr:choice-of-anchor D domain-containing protein [Burkholderia multivorans]
MPSRAELRVIRRASRGATMRMPLFKSRLKTAAAAALFAVSAAAFPSSYYVVVPVPNHKAGSDNILVTLNGYSLPAGRAGQAYSGFDFNTLLQVLGDPGYNPGAVHWSIAGGALPAGMSLSTDGKLTGTPAAGTTASFQVLASYKTKAGQQSYQLFIANLPANGVLSVSALNFGAQDVGATSPAQTVTLSNTGGEPLSIASITAQAPFAVSSSCGTTLQPNASCISNVTFTPTAMGPQTGTVNVSMGSGNSAVSLSGTGLQALIQAAPTSLSFATLEKTTSKSSTVTLTNTGNKDASSVAVTVPSGYSQTSTCGNTLAAGASCLVTVTFSPPATTSYNGSLEVDSSAAPVSVGLTGSGGAPVYTLSSSLLHFPTTNLGASSSAQLTVTNTGTAPGTPVISVPAHLSATSCGQLAPNASCTATFTFTPSGTADYSGHVTVGDAIVGTQSLKYVAPMSGSTVSVAASSAATAFQPAASVSMGYQIIGSPNQVYNLFMQGDCNFVDYNTNPPVAGGAIWSSATAGQGACYANLQSDGNLVVVSSTTNKALWAAGTGGHTAANTYLELDNDGALRLFYNGTPQAGTGTLLWQSPASAP